MKLVHDLAETVGDLDLSQPFYASFGTRLAQIGVMRSKPGRFIDSGYLICYQASTRPIQQFAAWPM